MKDQRFRLNQQKKSLSVLGWDEIKILETQVHKTEKHISDQGKEILLHLYSYICLCDGINIAEITQNEFLDEIENDIYQIINE